MNNVEETGAEASLTVLRKAPNGLVGHPASARWLTTYWVQDDPVCAGDGGPGDSRSRNPPRLSAVLSQRLEHRV